MYKILFMSSWKSARALDTPNGITFHLKTRPYGVINTSSSRATAVRSTCQNPLCLSILVLYLHMAIRSRVFSTFGILPRWFYVLLLTSPRSTTKRIAAHPGLVTKKHGLQ